MRVIVLSAFDLLVCVRALARRVCATGRARGIAATTDDDRLDANSAAISLRCDQLLLLRKTTFRACTELTEDNSALMFKL